MFWRSSLNQWNQNYTDCGPKGRDMYFVEASSTLSAVLWRVSFWGFLFKMLCQLYLDRNASLSGLLMKIPSVEHEDLYVDRQKFWSTILMNKYSYLSDSIIQMAKALINFPLTGSAIPLL